MKISGDRNTLLWFKGSNQISLVDVQKMKEIKIVSNALRGDVVRKLVATSDLRKSICLSLYDSSKAKLRSGNRGESKADVASSKGRILLEITSIRDDRLVFSKPYSEIGGKNS